MADGLRAGDTVGDVIEKTVKNYDIVMEYKGNDSASASLGSEKVNCNYYSSKSCDSAKLFDKLRENGSKHEGLLAVCDEEDCRKKRCVDRYDSSESSDSGVAVLSCTDCSGSSTASSDITDPGSPFSTASSHSEDSGTAPHKPPANKMPPAQAAPHPPWHWTVAADEASPPAPKRPLPDKTVFAKRLKSAEEPPPINTPDRHRHVVSAKLFVEKKRVIHLTKGGVLDSSLTNNNNNNNRKVEPINKMQQGKITEYFKTQAKVNGVKKELPLKSKTAGGKFVALINKQTEFKRHHQPSQAINQKKAAQPETKPRKFAQTVPRKILPAPSKVPESIAQLGGMHHHHHHHPFAPTVTLTAVSFPPNLAYLHTKSPKPPDNNIFVPQVSTIPLINRNPCLNVIQHHHPNHQTIPKLTALNSFNCVKLNATVVPIVKLNALPSRLNGSPGNIALSVDTAVPTVLSARSKPAEGHCAATPAVVSSPSVFIPKQYSGSAAVSVTDSGGGTHHQQQQCRNEKTKTVEPYRTAECQTQPQSPVEKVDERVDQTPSPTDSSDSGVSSKGSSLEVCVSDDPAPVESQKSPILSQPKTIRFPPVKRESKSQKDDGKDVTKSSPQSNDGRCRWDGCAAQFDTSGALLEHLQVKHVISQSQPNQEHFVCLWRGCKVHGRTSCSRSWLERHVLAHAGTKPFRCIVDGCGQRFNSQLMLERHVNGHFNSDGSQSGTAKKSVENGDKVKLFKRNGRIIRFRRQPWSARMFDFIDSGIMEGLQHKLLSMTQTRTTGKVVSAGDTVDLHSQILARRTESDGTVKLLIRWHPRDVVSDEWVPEKEYKSSRPLPIPRLSPASKEALAPALFPNDVTRPPRKHHRKPVKMTTT
ncbi:zinc finger protein jing isoform X2 [Cylas formicarius]|uniref:zinc finger protein jing isoform X2 n=1 Tax=Cylas formicarius TaxID=197179 RepID=UPI002958500A|nr:zinc finger protein jing isoform X2 [Cylas formicarius]